MWLLLCMHVYVQMCIDHTHTGSMQRSIYFFDPWSVWKRPPCIAIATSSKLDLVIHSLVSLILSLPQLIHYNNRRRLTGYHDNNFVVAYRVNALGSTHTHTHTHLKEGYACRFFLRNSIRSLTQFHCSHSFYSFTLILCGHI